MSKPLGRVEAQSGLQESLPNCSSEQSRDPRLDRQTDLGLTGAHGLNATVLEPNAENRGGVCSQSRRSLPSADGQTEDTRHEEQREQLAAPTIPPGGIFYRR